MEQEFRLGDGLSELERTLRELAPVGGRLDIAQTMFRAGQASARTQQVGRRFWPAATALLAVVSGTLGALLAVRDGSQVEYVWKGGAGSGPAEMKHDAIASRDGAIVSSRTIGEPTSPEEDPVRPDARWLSPLSRVRFSGLDTDDLWSLMPTTVATSDSARTTTLCLLDWPSLLEDADGRLPPAAGDTVPRFNWRDFLHLRDL